MRRLQISVGVVRALSNLDTDVAHNFGINTDTILLDENWEVKIYGLEYPMTLPTGSLDLEYEKLGIGTYKSDVFSIGIVLWELLCIREAFVSKDNHSFQAPLAIFHYENGTLHEYVDPDLFSQMDHQSFSIFSETAYNCLIHHRAPPNMNEVLKRLEKAFKVQQMHENNEQSTIAAERTLPDHLKLKLKGLQHMRIPLADILLATKNFSQHFIASGGYSSVYVAELDHVDKAYCFAMDMENVCEVTKERSTVAIKRIMDTEDEIAAQGFYAEIEILTICKHSNIISLLGFCDEGGALILIYEYASNGSLNYHIQNMSKNHNDNWAHRVKICLDVAKGLRYLHSSKGDRQGIVHRDIKSDNILLDSNFEAKLANFGLSVFSSASEEHYSTLYSEVVAGTPGYIDPQYMMDSKLKKESDIYSFGVLMFEILCGTLAYDPKYAVMNNKGLAVIAKQHFNSGTINKIVDLRIKEQITETFFTSVKGPNQESLDTFSRIAYRCLAAAQVQRPTMEDIVKELEKALHFEEHRKDILQISLKDIVSSTNNFSNEADYLGKELLWGAYRGEVLLAEGHTTMVDVKCISSPDENDHDAYAPELKVLMEHNHENVIGFLGYCEEAEKRIIVYEHALNGSLDRFLNDVSLTWGKRLKICIGVASALDFLHEGVVRGEVVIHRDIKSSNILLDADMNAKIAHFGLSVMHPVDQETVLLDIIGGTRGYVDPEYERTGVLSKECDIYSFGILLFEILFGRSAYSFHIIKKEEFSYRIGPLIKDLYKKGKLDEMMFKGTDEQIEPQSLIIFKRMAIQCLSDKREDRPTAREVIIQLKQALQIQEEGMDIARISLEDIKYATNNFSDEKCIGKGALGKVYKGQLPRANEQNFIVAKRWDGKYSQGHSGFYQELEILRRFAHKNVIGLEGYCDEFGEKIIVYEFASNGSLDHWLKKTSLTWRKRLEIGIDVASGLDFLHGGVLRREGVLHRNVKSSNILLSSDWKAKITEFGLSLIKPNNQETDHEEPVSNIDQTYMKTGTISKAADIYSFGVVLFEILCGISAHLSDADNPQYLISLAKNYYEDNKLDEFVFEGIKKEIAPQSLSMFAKVAYQCLHDDRHQRPTASDVLVQLNEALEFQEDHEKWEPKLPSDYKEIFQQSRTPEICDTEKKEALYNMLLDGILIQKGKVGFWLDPNNNKNEMTSATLFTYKNRSSQKWKRIRISRFGRVSMMMDISNLKIQAKIKAQFLSPRVLYGVYLVFKFPESNQVSTKPMYVNLKYKWENETLHAYFATRRDSEYLMIELYRFLNNKDDGDFEVLLDSFSRCYCRSGAIYVEGIEFAAIDNGNREEIEKLKDAQQAMRSNLQTGQMQQLLPAYDEVFESENYDEGAKPIIKNGKKHHMLSAKEVLYDSSNVKLFKLKPSEHSRFEEVIEVLSQQVFRIKCKIESQILSPDTDYSCYLIFKLSEKCRGLHCPVKVRGVHRPIKVEGQLQQNNKETKDLYFRTQSIWNIHDINQVPKQRGDGWTEVNVWKFNSNDQLINDCINVNLKLISYEGTMSGLIVCGLEFRPM